MYERFTDRARKVMQLANQEAQRFNHEYIGTEHILLGLVKEGSGVAANVLKNLDIDLRKIRLEVEKIVQSGPEMVTGVRDDDAAFRAVRDRFGIRSRNLAAGVLGRLAGAAVCGRARDHAWRPLARAILGGLSVSVVLTVFLVPAAYQLVYGGRQEAA